MKRIKKSIPLLGLLFLAPLSCFAHHWIPHIANGRFSGGSVRTAFILMNTTDVTVSAMILLTADDGSPLVVTIPNYGTDSSFRISIPPHRTVTIQTDGTGPLASGAATIDFNYFIGISAIFSIYDKFGNLTAETGIGGSFWFSSFSILVEASGGYTTGIAFFNPNSEPVSLSADPIENNGTRRIRGGIPGSPLPPKGHLARSVDLVFLSMLHFNQARMKGEGGDVRL